MTRELPTDDFAEAVELYFRSNPVCKKHESNVRMRCRNFIRWSGGHVSLSDLDADHINRYLIELEQGDRTPSTVRSYRSTIMSILRFMRWKSEEREYVRKIKVTRRKTEGWTTDEIERLLAVANSLEGFLFNGVSERNFFLTAILAGFSTGLRWGDLALAPVADIRRDGVAEVVQHKTGNAVIVCFSKAAMKQIKAHGQDVVLPCPHTQKWFCAKFSELVEMAEIRRGSFKFLRRSAGSYADLQNRGDGRRLLGHTSDAIFDNHYNVSSITAATPPQPPSLNGDREETPQISKLGAWFRRLLWATRTRSREV